MIAKYVAILHKDKKSAYGITLPDFPGCFSASDHWEQLTENIQESVELWASGIDNFEPPIASSPEEVREQITDDGILYIVCLDFSFINTKSIPVNISMPEYMKARIDRAAKNKKMNRSNFLINAAIEFGA